MTGFVLLTIHPELEGGKRSTLWTRGYSSIQSPPPFPGDLERLRDLVQRLCRARSSLPPFKMPTDGLALADVNGGPLGVTWDHAEAR